VRKTVKFVLNACVIFLIVSCGHTKWDWEADPYVADHKFESIINANDIEVFCNEPEFDDFTCFTSENIAELKFNIARLDIPDKYKLLVMKHFNRFIAKKRDIRNKGKSNMIFNRGSFK